MQGLGFKVYGPVRGFERVVRASTGFLSLGRLS